MLGQSFYSQNEFQAVDANRRPLANQMFNHSRVNSRLAMIKAFFTGKGQMPALAKRIAGCAIRAQHYLGLRSVEIKQIAGTESRADDFDADFNPRDDRIRDRWVRIAELRLRQANLPAIELIQVGSEYYIRDGHHRVSVARALGNAYIDAQVTVVEVTDPVQLAR